MNTVADIVTKVRSKNAGPFWLTVDIFCGTPDAFAQISKGLATAQVAAAFDMPAQVLKRFDIADLYVVKLSLPRPAIQGSIADRDMHGASWAALLADIEI